MDLLLIHVSWCFGVPLQVKDSPGTPIDLTFSEDDEDEDEGPPRRGQKQQDKEGGGRKAAGLKRYVLMRRHLLTLPSSRRGQS